MVRTEQVHCVISESFYIVYLAVFFSNFRSKQSRAYISVKIES